MARDPKDTCLGKTVPWIVIATLACVLLGCTNSDNNDDELFGPSSPPTPSPTNLLTSNPTTPPTPTPPSPSSPTPSAPGDVETPMPPTPIPTDLEGEEEPTEEPQCEMYEYTQVSTGACRGTSADDNDNSNYDVATGFDGSQEDCQKLCSANNACAAVEFKVGATNHCELWKIKPQFGTGVTSYACFSKAPKSYEFTPVSSGACLVFWSPSWTSSNYERLPNFDGTQEDCQRLCSESCSCLAIEFKVGASNHCELWKVLPQLGTMVNSYVCLRKE